MRFRATVLMAAALVVAACDSSTDSGRYNAEGTWSGQETNGPTHLSLTLTQKGDSVFGTGKLTSTWEPEALGLSVKVAGLATASTFDVMLTATRYAPLQITGGFTGRDDVEAFMVGSGYIGEQVLLHRD
jgi:hypothetical protein